MPPLVIRIKKKTDGSAALSCVRPDGTTTWQRQQGQQGAFFPRHDLTHYAVEGALGYDRAFFGLVAAGWDLGDFGKPWPRGPLPDQALDAELLVGFLDAERAGGVRWTAEDFRNKAEGYYGQRGIPRPGPQLTDADLARIRADRARLFERWRALPAGETLELSFPAET